jgi:hypothetical protein
LPLSITIIMACGGGASPYLRHAVVFDAGCDVSSAVPSDRHVIDAHFVPARSSSDRDFRSEPLSSPLQPQGSSPQRSLGTLVAANVHKLSDVIGASSPGTFEPAHSLHPSQSKSSVEGKGGVGLIFEKKNTNIVVCGVIPGGDACARKMSSSRCRRSPLVLTFRLCLH